MKIFFNTLLLFIMMLGNQASFANDRACLMTKVQVVQLTSKADSMVTHSMHEHASKPSVEVMAKIMADDCCNDECSCVFASCNTYNYTSCYTNLTLAHHADGRIILATQMMKTNSFNFLFKPPIS